MSLKELKQWIIWIIVIILLFLLILLFRVFVINKNLKVGTDRKADDNSQSASLSNSSENKNSKIDEFVDDFKEGYNEGKENEHEYSDYNFDDRLLMYEGDVQGKNINSVLDLLITDADDNFYSKPDVRLVNFENANNTEIVCDDIETYKSDIEEIKTKIDNNATYNISFEYGALNAIAKEVIITKK